MKQYMFKGRQYQLITKRSDGTCLIMRQYKREGSDKVYIRRLWAHFRDLSLPSKAKTEPKPRPGVKRAQPKTKTLSQIVAKGFDQIIRKAQKEECQSDS